MEELDEEHLSLDGNGRLILKYNDFRRGIEISFSQRKFENMHYLDISHNQISNLPNELTDLILLKDLIIEHNELSDLPDNLGNLRHLARLYLNNNKLSILPTSIASCKKLIEIRLQSNQLKELPFDMFGDRYNPKQYHQQLTINITDNPDLVMIPKPLRELEHSDTVLWILNLYYEHKKSLDNIRDAIFEVDQAISSTEDEMKELEEKRIKLLKLKNDMEINKMNQSENKKLRNRIKMFIASLKSP